MVHADGAEHGNKLITTKTSTPQRVRHMTKAIPCVAAAGLLAMASSASAITIDTFSNRVTQLISDDNTDKSSTESGVTGVIGGVRDIYLNNVSGASQIPQATAKNTVFAQGCRSRNEPSSSRIRSTLFWRRRHPPGPYLA